MNLYTLGGYTIDAITDRMRRGATRTIEAADLSPEPHDSPSYIAVHVNEVMPNQHPWLRHSEALLQSKRPTLQVSFIL